jgi:hypothetical protein
MQQIHSLQTQVAELEAQLEMSQQDLTESKREGDKALAEMRRQMERAM